MGEPRKLVSGLVSVILPVHNGERYLREAVESVLRQEYRPLEIVIVDDGSTDGTAEMAKALGSPTRYFRQANSGPASARNLGLRYARGEFIAFIDADDLWPADKLLLQMRCFAERPSTEIVQGLIRRIWIPPASAPRNPGAPVDEAIFYTNLGSMVMRRSVLDGVGHFDEGLAFHEDSDLWLRAREHGVQIRLQRRVALLYRIHGSNLTTGADMKTTGFLGIIRRSLERRRNRERELGIGYLPALQHCDPEVATSAHGHRPPSEWPLVTAVLYGRASRESRHRALSSVKEQHYQRIELIFLDREFEAALARVTPFAETARVVQSPEDVSSSLNAALEIAHGELIAFLRADATWSPNKLKLQVTYLLEHPQHGYASGVSRSVLQPMEKYPEELLRSASMGGPLGDLLDTLLIRRSTVADVGGFESGHAGMEATDWQLRATDRGFSRGVLPAAISYRFLQAQSEVTSAEQKSVALLDSVRASVLRKRNSGGGGFTGSLGNRP